MDNLDKSFSFLAQELFNAFPCLDLKLNHLAEEGKIRLFVNQRMLEPIELKLAEENPLDLLNEATFSIKELAGIWDA